MNFHLELKERKEAEESANSQFRRVKQDKLNSERAKIPFGDSAKPVYEKKQEREMANRVSAAASRAKLVCYSKNFEKRTDRLELERNREALRADRALRKLNTVKKETKLLTKVLRDLWDMKEERACSYFLNSDVLFLLGKRQDDTELSLSDSDDDRQTNSDFYMWPAKLPPLLLPIQHYQTQIPVSSYKNMLPVPLRTHQPLLSVHHTINKPKPRSNRMDLRHLINQPRMPDETRISAAF